MKILVITQYFSPENFRINDLVAGMRTRGHDITVLTGLPNYPKGEFFEGYNWSGPWTEAFHGARIIRMPIIPRGNGGGFALTVNYISCAISMCLGVVFRLCKKDGFDAIFVFEPSPITVGIPAALARWRFRIPVLFWVLDLWPETLVAVRAVRSKRVLACVDRLVRWIYGHCDRILVPSRAFTPQILRHGVNGDKVSFFPNWGEPVFQRIEGAAAAYPGWPDGFCILFAGNLGVAQDFPAVLDAADRLKDRADIHWVVAGDGRIAEWAKSEVARCKLERTVHFLGQLPLEKMPILLRKADALLLSLKSNPVFSLTIPGKLQSYLAGGKPIVAMLEGEAARIVKESGAGLVCSAGDSAALASAVSNLANMEPRVRDRMGAAGRSYFEKHFARDIVLDSLDTMLADAVRTCKIYGYD